MSSPTFPKIDTLYERGEDFKVDTSRVRRPEFLIPRGWVVTEKIHGCNVRVSLENIRAAPPGETTFDTEWGMRFDGRKANSQMPPLLAAHLQDVFTLEGLQSLWRCKKNCGTCGGESWTDATDEGRVFCTKLEPYPVTLYGEGYGGGVQKGGGGYTSKAKGGAASFRLFDVLVGGTWLRRADVEDVAAKLGVKPVPLIAGTCLRPMAGQTTPDLGPMTVNLGGVTVTYDRAPWDLASITEAVKRGIPSLVAADEGTEGHMAEGVVAFTEEPLYNNRGQRLMFKLKAQDF